jgi:hypothetical protein
MASLAPGNGWFPSQSSESRRQAVVGRKVIPGQSNVYPFPPARPAAGSGMTAADLRGPISRAAASVLLESARRGRSGAWLLGCTAFGLVLATLAWMGLAGALFAAAIVAGVPWITAAGAFAAAHVLAATVATLVCVRVARNLLKAEKLQQLRADRS